MSMADHNPDPLQITPDPQTLHAYHRQQLSAMLDGELSPDEAKFMLRRLEHDVELARCWERWQICGEVLRGRADEMLSGDFAARVAVAIRAPLPHPGRSAQRRPRRRALYWGGAGMAASLALVAITVALRWPEPVTVTVPDSLTVAATGAPSPMPAPEPQISAVQSAPTEVLPAPPPVATSPQTPDIVRGMAVATRPDRSERAARELLAPTTTAQPVVPRPWPRAGAGSGQLTVGYQAAPMMRTAPFSPRWLPPAPAAQSASRAASDLTGTQAKRGVVRQD